MKCYGKFQNDHADCKICQYAESCRYYTLTAHSVDSSSGFPSYEAMQKFLPDQCDDSNTPGESDESTQNELYPMLSSFFRYLVDLMSTLLGSLRKSFPRQNPESTVPFPILPNSTVVPVGRCTRNCCVP